MKQKGVQVNKTMIAAVCLFLVFVTLITVVLNKTYVHSIKNLVRNTTTANIHELTVSKAEYLDERLRSEQLALQTLANSIGLQEDIFSSKDLAMDYKNLHNASCMWILDTQGNGWSSRGGNDLFPPGQTETFFTPALQGETGISEVFIGALGKRQVLFYTPIQRDDQIVGGLYESYPAELLQNTYGSATYNDAGYSYVLGKNGNVVLSPVRFSYLQIYDNFRDVLKDGQNNSEAITLFMDALQSNRKGSATFIFEGEEQFLSFTPLGEKEGWYFVTVIPLSMVERDGTVIVNLTARMTTVLVVAITLTIFLLFTVIYYRDRKRREYELYIQNIYQAISQNIDTVIFIVDSKSGKIEYAFENVQEILGVSAQDFYQPIEVYTDSFRHDIFEILQKERPKEKAMWERSLYNDILNQQMWLKITALPVTLRGTLKYIFAITDITQDQQIRENLSAAVVAAEQANAAKSLFLSNMSHDIRTPMNAIVGMTKLADIHIDDKVRVEDCLHKIELSSRHLLSLINDVLDMSKIESGKMTMAADPFSLPELIEEDLAIIQPQCRAKKQKLNVVTKNIRHEYLIGDSLRLNQIILNLISNAVKFTPEQGEITLSIEELSQKHPGYAAYQLQVVDTGIGIAPEFLSNIFLPFERESIRKVNQTEGTGLGLAISKNIVEAMGGQIFVESTLGKGTTFTVALELQLQLGAIEELESTKVLIGLHALLVDDSAADLELVRLYLTEFGMTVDVAASGEEAIVLAAEKGPYDLIVLDWKLPGMNGIETAQQIQASANCTTSVLLTAFDTSAMETDISQQTFDLILQKPIFKSALCRKLSALFNAQAAAPDHTTSQNIMNGKRFLLVEDNALNCEIAMELFALSGAIVESADNGLAGLEIFCTKEKGYYDAIFMDIQMPVMDGYEATKRIRASKHPQAQDIPIIAMSANVFAEDIHACYNAGMNAHVGKPITMTEIYQVLREFL